MTDTGDGRLGGWLRRLYGSSPLARSILAGPASVRRKAIGRRNADTLAVTARMASRIAEDIVLDMPEFEGQFVCSPKSHLLRRVLLRDSYEPEVVALFRQHLDTSRDVIDVGANIGFFTVLAAQLLEQGRVLAVEPTGAAFERLTSNIAHNNASERVLCFHGAASDHSGEVTIHAVEGREEYASLEPVSHPSVAGEQAELAKVSATTLDDLVAHHQLDPGLVKIDVEGAEMLVLKGAAETIRRNRPVVLCEIAQDLLAGFGNTQQEVIEFFCSRDYRVIDTRDPERAPDSRLHGEILCLPN